MSKGKRSQLEIDLEKRVNERITQVCTDAFDLFRVAGLEPQDAAAAVGLSTLHMAARIMAVNATPEGAKQAAEIFERMVNQYSKQADTFFKVAGLEKRRKRR